MIRNLPTYTPVYLTQRGETVESVRFGAAAVVNSKGELIASIGDPNLVTFLRSTAKPFQVTPFLENGGAEIFKLSEREVAVLCSSHSGTDEHIKVIQGIQAKTGVSESDLLCGIQYPIDKSLKEKMLVEGKKARPNHHNCSGMHTALVSREKMMEGGAWTEKNNSTYIENDHPIQREIISTISDMSGYPENDVQTGSDGCCVPSFALPLRRAALAYARLCDPDNSGVHPLERAATCRLISKSMTANPEMVAGRGRFDTLLMQAAGSGIVSKSGAEGVHAIGIMPGFIEPGSLGLGIFIKISDGDQESEAGPAVAVALLDALGVLDSKMKSDLAGFGPDIPILNSRCNVAGKGFPIFELEYVNNMRTTI